MKGSRAEASRGRRRSSREASRGSGQKAAEPRWILLVHQLPPRPVYLRAKIRNRLEAVGAVPLKNSVYVLPRTPECLEDLQWIAQEAVGAGGEAWVCEADFSFGLEADEIVEKFRRARNAEFEAIAEQIRKATQEIRRRRRSAGEAAGEETAGFARLEKRLHDAIAIDFFSAAGRHGAEMELETLRRLLRGHSTDAPRGPRTARSELVGRTWVTRAGVQIDRIASAWLIRRFIDSEARFRFVAAGTTRFDAGELRFDMIGGDFTHEGDRCTFETLVQRADIADPAVREIGEIVHDIDLKDGKYGRADAAGIQRLVVGLVLAQPEDEARLTRGFALFDDLYQSFSRAAGFAGMPPRTTTPKGGPG